MKPRLALLVLAAASALSLSAQARDSAAESGVEAAKALDLPFFTAEGEQSLRRFEIIALGSFPISLLYTNFSFSLGGYLASGFDPVYAPWPFSSDRAPSLSDEGRLLRIGVAAGLSLGIAALDAFLLPRARARRAALRGLGPLPPSSPAGPGSALPGLENPPGGGESGSPPSLPEAELDSGGGSD